LQKWKKIIFQKHFNNFGLFPFLKLGFGHSRHYYVLFTNEDSWNEDSQNEDSQNEDSQNEYSLNYDI
jgi:hypothetical protein